MFVELSMAAQTAYAEVFDQNSILEIDSLSSLPGAFYTRVIKGKEYVYFGYRDANSENRMIYVGPNDSRVKLLVEKFNLAKSYKNISKLVRSAQVLGCQSMLQKHF